MTVNEDPWVPACRPVPAETYARLMVRGVAARTFLSRCADALEATARAEKALSDVAANDTGCSTEDIGGDAGDALAEFRDAARHLRNAFRLAIGHERDVRDEIAAAKKGAGSD